MDFIVIGINHITAPIEIREKVVFSDDEVQEVLGILKNNGILSEGMIVSTCNRTELYGVSFKDNNIEEYIRNFLNEFKGVDYFTREDYFYVYKEQNVVRHLFRVTGGLDSMVVGEPQIFGQIKDAYSLSCKCKANNIFINKLLHWSFRVGKRIRSETNIGIGAVSVSLAAVELAQKIFKDLNNRKVFLIGAGETGVLSAKHLKEKVIGELFITNRTFSKAERLALDLDGKAVPFEMIEKVIPLVDVVISTTGSQEIIVDYEKMKKCMHIRGQKPIFIIDIAVPRDFSPEIAKIENVFLHNIDDLRIIVDKNVERRKSEIPKAEKIVEEEVKSFHEWYKSLEIIPTIKMLKERFENIRRSEFEEHKKKFTREDWEQLNIFTKHFVNTLLHKPISKIKTFNEDPYAVFRIIDAINEIFDIGKTKKDDDNI